MVAAASITTMLFYNQVLGVSAALCGTAFFIASVVDGISDPLVGGLSDSVQTRWGRRHPFMLGAAFPLGLCFYLMYQPPDGLSEQGLFWWFTLTMVGMRIAKTFYAVPHAALGAELTEAGAADVIDALRRAFADAEVEVVSGGQAHYDYIISLE